MGGPKRATKTDWGWGQRDPRLFDNLPGPRLEPPEEENVVNA